MTEDPKLSRRYRELPPEEPPRHVDEAILAKARGALEGAKAVRPAPLVVPSGRSRWYFPLGAAAVIMLAVAVTLQIEREQPAEELVTQPSEPIPTPEPPAAPEAARSQRFEMQGAPARVPQAAPAPLRREAASDALASGSFSYASPEQWLQGIADLRRQNRDDEADRQLAEFRKRYPDYRISKEMLEKLELPK
jgi:hypothetical protein